MTAVVVADLGYLGLTLAMRIVAVGHDMAGYDTDPVGGKRLEADESYMEGLPSSQLAATMDSAGSTPRRAPTPAPALTSL